MKEAISVINQKGGVGKSTTALAIGAGLMLKRHKVLFIDLDPQGNLSYCMRADSNHPSALDLLTGNAKIEDVIQKTEQGDIIASAPGLTGADTFITGARKEYRLSDSYDSSDSSDPVKKKYDYFIIDTPPALGILTVNAMTASQGIIIPAQADIFSLQGIVKLYETIRAVRLHTNPDLKIKGILLTRHNSRTILSRDLTEIISATAKQLDTRLYKTTIREAIAIKEAQINQQSLFEYAPRSNASKDYKAFIDEMLKRR